MSKGLGKVAVNSLNSTAQCPRIFVQLQVDDLRPRAHYVLNPIAILRAQSDVSAPNHRSDTIWNLAEDKQLASPISIRYQFLRMQRFDTYEILIETHASCLMFVIVLYCLWFVIMIFYVSMIFVCLFDSFWFNVWMPSDDVVAVGQRACIVPGLFAGRQCGVSATSPVARHARTWKLNFSTTTWFFLLIKSCSDNSQSQNISDIFRYSGDDSRTSDRRNLCRHGGQQSG